MNSQVRYGQLVVVDWGKLRVRPGQYVCPEHGVVRPWRQIVPACRDCGRAVHLAVDSEIGVAYQEPAPTHCAGHDRHTFGPKLVSLGTAACSCSPTGLHRTWTCRRCGDVQMWPPHNDVDTAPYFGPGSGVRERTPEGPERR
jgi:hypothetical protein